MNQPTIGDTGLPPDAQQAVSDLIAELSQRYHFRQGTTAALFDSMSKELE